MVNGLSNVYIHFCLKEPEVCQTPNEKIIGVYLPNSIDKSYSGGESCEGADF